MQFFIDDDEDDDDEPAGYDNGNPVAIDGTAQGGSPAGSRQSIDGETAQAENVPNEFGEPVKAAEPPIELVEVKHKVARGDTLMSIARKYASDVSIVSFSSPSSLVGMMERPSLYLATAHRLPHHRSGLDSSGLD